MTNTLLREIVHNEGEEELEDDFLYRLTEIQKDIKKGSRAFRHIWKKGSFIYLEKGKTIKNDKLRNPQKQWFKKGMKIKAHYNFVDEKGNVHVGYNLTLEDQKAEDWEILRCCN